MIQGLSGQTHRIYTANIVVFNCEPNIKYEWVGKSEVTFGEIDL
jgi:predicted house-cleaning NTP pyrophosphatase (Maf/HAM1 superfamily)